MDKIEAIKDNNLLIAANTYIFTIITIPQIARLHWLSPIISTFSGHGVTIFKKMLKKIKPAINKLNI
ncbi:hypothetical protein A4R26_27725 [Niastella populi]|uniref:Uncharacterized protein n=1 Tax=Niastella populi TaxID=550983 RepID=A0A1V9F7Y4_9BACT|nr:hypothetical protein A4R26_27725 [Niastella populi]